MVMEMGHHHRYLGKVPLSPESAIAADIFDQFAAAQTFKAILSTFRHLCDTLRLKPCNFPQFYPKLKAKLPSWKAQALWAKLDKRAAHKCYQRGKACANTRVLIIGGGPCGLRAAIEAQLLGAKVVVIEKRDRFSRNNVLHLWSYVIHDLRALGAKKLFGKFCAGSLDHISIRQLQCILLKVSLLLGVEVHENVTFEKLIEPPVDQSEEKIGWRAQVSPADHPVSQYEFDVLIGADGKRNTLRGFKRKEFRGKLAIAITANFINRRSEEEARVEEISGVAFIFNQKFFQDMRETVGIDLENIVYYKDDTHYFVMTAKKHSLIEKGVIVNDYSDTAKLLAPDNVDREALMEYAREAADFATNGHLPTLDFAVNHYGQADVAMFDFTSMYAAENACKVLERRGYRLLMGLVGDSLLEPFWPTGSGCARGFLSSLDACWMIRSWSMGVLTPLQVLAQRESVYRLLAQTTPENLSKDHSEHTLNPHSRYPNLNADAVRPMQVLSLYDSDSPIKDEVLEMPVELPKKRQKKDSVIHPNTLLQWCQRQVALYDNVQIENMTTSWKSGLASCAIIHRYRPDLIDFHSLQADDVVKNNELVFTLCDREFGISPVMSGQEMLECETPDNLTMVSYVTQLYDIFHGEIPHVRRPMQRSPSDELVSLPVVEKRSSGSRLPHTRIGRKIRPAPERSDRNSSSANLNDRIAKKRRSLDKERAVFIASKENKSSQPFIDGQSVKFSDRVKNLEELFSGKSSAESASEDQHRFSSLDLDLRASTLNPLNECPSSSFKVGRLDRGDWNVKMLEERLKERNQVKKNIESVPKWSRECFEDKLKAMTDKSRGQSEERTEKYSDFDQRLHQLDVKLKEGNALQIGQRGSNKVSVMAEQLASVLDPKQEHAPINQTNIRPYVPSGGSEKCHFCSKRVYLMERVSAQGKFFHRGCFKCEYCGTTLRLGSYGYAADGNFGGKFLCMQHFGMPLNFTKTRLLRGPIKPLPVEAKAGEALTVLDGVSDKLRGATPERAEFENSSIMDQATEDETLSEMDEDEWTDRNFGTSATDMESTDEESDFSSEEISDGDDQAFEEVFNRSITSEETRWLAESWKRKHGQETGEKSAVEETDEDYVESDDEFSYEPYENEGVDNNSDLWVSSPESKPDLDEAAPLRSSESEVAGSITSPDSLARDDSSDNDSEEITSNEEDDEDDEEDDVDVDDDSVYGETDDEDGEAKKTVVREIPAIIINEFPTSQSEPELVNDQMKTEEEVAKVEVEVEEVIVKVEEEEEEEEVVVEPPIPTINTPDSEIRESEITELNATCEESSSEAIIMGSDVESTDSTENEIKQDILPVKQSPTSETNNSLDDMFELDSLLPQFESTPKVVLRKRDIGMMRRELDIKSVIEPLQKPLEDVTINDSNDVKRNDETSPTKTLESASSLPNLIESVNQEEKKEDKVSTSRMLKLKERYLLGETKPAEPAAVACSPEKPSPKMESVFKNVLEMIAEKQKMLTPSPPSVSAFSCSMYNKPTAISLVKVDASPKVVVTTAEDLADKSSLSTEQDSKISSSKENETYEKSTNSNVIINVNEYCSEQSDKEIEEIEKEKESKPDLDTHNGKSDCEKTDITEIEEDEFDVDETFVTFRKKATAGKENDENSQSPEVDMDITPTAQENFDSSMLIPREEKQTEDQKSIDNINQNKMEKTPPMMIPRYEGGFTKKVGSAFSSFRESLESNKSARHSPPTETISTHIPVKENDTQDNKKVEKTENHVEEIPFADDEDTVQHEENNSKPLSSVFKMPLDKLREFCSVEREKARQQARERARLKSDEELGLSTKLLPDCRMKLEEEICRQLQDEHKSIRTETNSDRRRKSATWSGFGKKPRKLKGSDSNDANKSKVREPRGLFSMLTNFSKSEGRKSKGRDKTTSSSTSSTKSRSSDTSDSSKDKIRRMLLAHQKLKEKKYDSSDSNNATKDAMEIPHDLTAENSSSLSALASSAPKAIEDSFSDSEGEESLPEKVSSTTSSSKRDKEQAEEKLRKLQRIAQKLYRRQEQKRLRVAQEIQRQLEEVEVKQRELEMRGVQVECALRGERDEEGKDETSLMQEWFALVREKNILVRHEEELLVRAKELELEDRHSRLQQSLSDRIAVEDSQKTAEEIEEEGRILTEMLEIGEQRDALGAFLEERFNSSTEGETKFPVGIEEACSSAN